MAVHQFSVSVDTHGKGTLEITQLLRSKISESGSSVGTISVGEGTDMPYIDVVILASGGKSSIRLLQRIGRGLRTPEGKDSLLVIDFQDWFNPILLRHSLARQKTFREYYNL